MKSRHPRLRSPRTLLHLACAALVGLACGDPTSTTPPPDTAPTETSEASKPAPVIPPQVLMPIEGEKTISYKLWFRVGSQDDPPGKEGLAWMTAELLAQGGTQSKSYAEIVDALYPMASGYSAFVDREMTTVSGRTHVDNRAAFEALLVDAVTIPAFSQTDMDRIRAEGLNQIEKSLRYAQDEELAKAGLYQFAFEGTPYAHPAVGTVAGLQSITIADVKAFYAEHYTQASLVIGLGGGYDAASVDGLEAARAKLPAGEAPIAPEVSPPGFEGRHLRLIDKPGADASISFGFPLDVHRGEKDFYALWIANSWLGEHRNSSSHLFQVIREERGLNYGDYSYIEVFPYGGWRQMPPTNVARREQLFEVWIRTLPNEHAHFALRAAVRELDHLVEHGLTAEQFELTRKFLRKYVLHFADNTSDRLGYALDDAFYGIEEGHLKRFAAMMANS